MNVVVDLPAVRPGRFAAAHAGEPLGDEARTLRSLLRAAPAQVEEIRDGIALVLRLDVQALAALADATRALADRWPFLSFRLLEDAPRCRLEVTGTGAGGGFARAVFRELAA
ncbi:MAG: hypothetical protein KIT14_11995 [bacterium]|nr:hypothetical protein [bacterium]